MEEIVVKDMSEEEIQNVVDKFEAVMREKTFFHMGYPYNLHYDYGCLTALTQYSLNNLGDPFKESNYAVHSRAFELAVLDWFADIWKIKRSDYWGYVTNCGTEGNLEGILIGRENYPDGILFASKDSHYSVFKAAKMFRMPYIMIPSQENGEIDYVNLFYMLDRYKKRPAIISLNIGTTMKGAVDNVDRVLSIIKLVGQDRFYIHCDGALFGMMMPFVANAPRIGFDKDIHSISVSGHKFVGSPVPCGVFITRKPLIIRLKTDIEYLNSNDITIMGSRNGHTPIYMWRTLCQKGMNGIKKDVETCINNAQYLHATLEKHGIKSWLNKLSCTVVFQRPSNEAFITKWQLACQGDKAHVVIMPNHDITKINIFINDLVANAWSKQ